MVHYSTCPLCSSVKISEYLSCTDHFISRENFHIWRCRECGFTFTQDHPDETDIGRYYESEDYISHTGTSTGLSNKLYLLARRFMLRRKEMIIRKVTASDRGRLLDIGSGTGHFADKMTRSGWDVKGLEINKKARDFASMHFGLDILDPKDITTLKSESFDIITLWHVLEHFHDPFAYTAEIVRLLKPDGTCFIALPNCGSSDAGFYGKFWAAYDVPRHLWHFNPLTFNAFAEKTGLAPEKVINLPLDAFYISVLSERYKGSNVPLVTGLVRGLMFSASSLFDKNKASSLIYVLHKI